MYYPSLTTFAGAGFPEIFIKTANISIFMNKKRGLIVFALIAVIMSSFLVAAQTDIVSGLKDFGNGLLDIITSFTETLFGANGVGDNLFYTIFLLVIITGIVFVALSQVDFFEEKKGITLLIAFAAAYLGIRFFIQPGWIETILLPYNALALALTVLIPFAVYFWVVEKIFQYKPTIRKIMWIVAIVMFVGLYFARAEAIGKAVGEGKFNPAILYLLAALISGLVLIFDGTIARKMADIQIQRLGETNKIAAIAKLRTELANYQAMVIAGTLSQADYNKLSKDIIKRITFLQKH